MEIKKCGVPVNFKLSVPSLHLFHLLLLTDFESPRAVFVLHRPQPIHAIIRFLSNGYSIVNFISFLYNKKHINETIEYNK